ncbi:hypothetical protein BKA61DRAFT_689993 [Leptodontidium sp. MPI-SDFR-AT-0119]|nr:hypothetical protein BKA61DRAFT_689993 [Leptodontidium sp. MPI-SDFR-AT-0119]
MAALVLCDEGALEYGAQIGAKGISRIPIKSKIGVVLFLVVSIATTIVTVLLFRIWSRLDESDQYVLYSVAASLPFIFARVIYGFLGAWVPDPSFAFFQGSVLLQGYADLDDTDVDSASIQGRQGDDFRESGEEKYVPIGVRESAVGERYLGIVTSEYLPPLTKIDSAIVFDDRFYLCLNLHCLPSSTFQSATFKCGMAKL